MYQSHFFKENNSRRFISFSSNAENHEHTKDKVEQSVRLRDYRHADDVDTKRNPEVTHSISKSELLLNFIVFIICQLLAYLGHPFLFKFTAIGQQKSRHHTSCTFLTSGYT